MIMAREQSLPTPESTVSWPNRAAVAAEPRRIPRLILASRWLCQAGRLSIWRPTGRELVAGRILRFDGRLREEGEEEARGRAAEQAAARDATGVSIVCGERRFCNFGERQQLAHGAPVIRMPLYGTRRAGGSVSVKDSVPVRSSAS